MIATTNTGRAIANARNFRGGSLAAHAPIAAPTVAPIAAPRARLATAPMIAPVVVPTPTPRPIDVEHFEIMAITSDATLAKIDAQPKSKSQRHAPPRIGRINAIGRGTKTTQNAMSWSDRSRLRKA